MMSATKTWFTGLRNGLITLRSNRPCEYRSGLYAFTDIPSQNGDGLRPT